MWDRPTPSLQMLRSRPGKPKQKKDGSRVGSKKRCFFFLSSGCFLENEDDYKNTPNLREQTKKWIVLVFVQEKTFRIQKNTLFFSRTDSRISLLGFGLPERPLAEKPSRHEAWRAGAGEATQAVRCTFAQQRCISTMQEEVPLKVYYWRNTQWAPRAPGGKQSGKKKPHKLIAGTPAGCPWHTRRDKQGSTGRCHRDFLLFKI